MIWLCLAVLGLGIVALAGFVFRVPRAGLELLGAALLVGMAGYALQGSPGQPAAPKAPAEKIGGQDSAALVAARQKLGEGRGPGESHVVIADALARHGQFADAAEVLRGAVEKDPANAEAWLAMANALVGHAEGTISPAALYAYGQAARAAPNSPGPSFFLGMALIQSGRMGEGRALWADLLARSPKEAPWRADLEKRLGELDSFMARQGTPAGPAQ